MKNQNRIILILTLGAAMIWSSAVFSQQAAVQSGNQGRIEIVEVPAPAMPALAMPALAMPAPAMPAPAMPANLQVIPWVQSNDQTWKQGNPFFHVADESGFLTADGWLGVTTKYILLRVIVKDQSQFNDKEKGNIWDGDSLQIGIDALGNGAGDRPSDSRIVEPDTGSITVALTKRGPEIWAHFLGKYTSGYMQDGKRDYPCRIVRDETAKTTTYDISFPWDEFTACAGMSPFFGMCVQVNDTESGPQKRLYWGHGADGEPRPGLFNRMALGKPPVEVFAAEPTLVKLWRPGSYGEISFVVAADGDYEFKCVMNGVEKSGQTGKLSLKNGVSRFKVRGFPAGLPQNPVVFEASLRNAAGRVMAGSKVELTAPGYVILKLHDKIEELAASSPHPLFTKHLWSLDALVQAEWNRGLFMVDTSPNVAESCVRDAKSILDGLTGDAGKWETYVKGERALVCCRSASPDSSLQFYLFRLPANWDPEKTYPLIVDLHGAGPSNPLFYIMANMQPKEDNGKQAKPEVVDPQQYFRLMPWGRGNSGYMEWGETDVWDDFTEVSLRYKIDKNRTFLTGHSMGGGGAWQLALRAPDVWAAVCPVSGASWRVPRGIGLGRNVAYIPFRIWHGDADGSVPVQAAYDMQTELRRYGNEPEMVIVPGQGHDYPWAAQVDNAIWLLKHERKRPDQFSFMADTDKWRGAWGITMARDLKISSFPKFECVIKGNVVRIDSEGTSGLTVKLGADGLGLDGNVVVWWNGAKSYEGPVKEIRLGEGGGR